MTINTHRIVDIRTEAPPVSWGVSVVSDAIEQVAEGWKARPFVDPQWDYPGLPKELNDSDWYTFCVVGCAVIACIWAPEGSQTWATEYGGDWLDDAPGVFACFSKLIESNGRFDLEMFSQTSAEAFFYGRRHLQLIEEKWSLLQQVVAAIHQQWDGSIENLVDEAGRNAVRVAALIGEAIPGFKDTPSSPRGLLPFQKLAQLATSMMSSGGSAPFEGVEQLPVFPDYMLPRVLRHMGILEYSKGLSTAVDSRRTIRSGSLGELAMRWATVYSADRLLEALRARGVDVSTPQLDFALWEAAVLGPEASHMGEHHRTIGLAY